MTAAERIAFALGRARRSAGGWWSCRCPAHDDRSPSLSIRDGDQQALIVKCFAGCEPRDILAELRRCGLLDGPAEYRPVPAAADRRRDNDIYYAARRIEIARRIWGEARDARGSPVAHYLCARGITLPVPPTLRYAPSLRRRDGPAPRCRLWRRASTRWTAN